MDKVFDRGLRAFRDPPAGSAAAYPVTLGYEMVSEVVEVAPDVTDVKIGDLRRAPHPHQEWTRSWTWPASLATACRCGGCLAETDERLERALFISLVAAVALQAVHDAEVELGNRVRRPPGWAP